MYDRNVGGQTLTFRFNPNLLKGNLLFEDVETGSVWSQLEEQAVKGPWKGTELRTLPVLQTTWKRWKQMHPNTLVLSPSLGLGKKSYEYRSEGSGGEGFVRGRHPGELVLGLVLGTAQKAYPFHELRKAGGKIWDQVQAKMIEVIYDETSETAWIRDDTGALLPAVTVYWKSWLEFHPRSAVYRAKKRSVQGALEAVDKERRTFRVVDEKTGEARAFTVGEHTLLKAGKRVLGKEPISWADLSPGLRVKVEFMEGVREARTVEVTGPRP